LILLGFKMLLLTIILTFVLFAGGIGFGIAYGKSASSAPFANCISFSMKHSFVQLSTDEDCSEQQFAEAVTYYKAHGYPVESSSMDLLGTKALQLQSEEMAKNEADLMK
jgi:hypothetical protein